MQLISISRGHQQATKLHLQFLSMNTTAEDFCIKDAVVESAIAIASSSSLGEPPEDRLILLDEIATTLAETHLCNGENYSVDLEVYIFMITVFSNLRTV